MSVPFSLLLSTPNAIWHFDGSTERLHRVHASLPEYYGISWNERGVVLSHSLDDNLISWTDEDFRSDRRFGVCVQYACDGTQLMSPRSMLHPHQLECVDKRVVAANTGRNSITLWDPSSGGSGDVSLIASRWDGMLPGTISLHLNSVHVQDGLLYSVAHNGNLLSCVWVHRWPAMDLHAVFSTSARWAHNAWHSAELAGLLICDSKAGRLLSVDYNEAVWSTATPATITRGLAATEKYLVVGLSEFTPRAERNTSKGGFALINRASLRTEVEYWFDGIGNVHEVRVVSEADACHAATTAKATLSSWIEAGIGAQAHNVEPTAKTVQSIPVRTRDARPLPKLLEYGEGSGLTFEVLAPGVARVRTQRVGDSNVVIGSLFPEDLQPRSLLRARGWCTVEEVGGESYGILRVCYRDHEGAFMPELEARSNPVGFAENRRLWFDVACVAPDDARVARADFLWLQSGAARILLKDCELSLVRLPGPLNQSKAIATAF